MKNLSLHSRIVFASLIGIVCLMAAAPLVMADGEDVWTSFIAHGDIDQAIKAFEDTIANNPKDALAHAGLALLSSSRPSGDKAALDHWLEAFQSADDQPEAYLFLFEILKELDSKEDFQKSLACFDKVLQRDGLSERFVSLLKSNRALLLKRLGRWDESAQAYAESGYITGFWYCGPFDNAEEGGHERVFGPEQNLDLTATYEGRRQTIGWRPILVEPYNGYINLHSIVDPSNESTTYLTTVVQSSVAQNCKIYIGHGGALKAWLNGKLLVNADRYHRPVPDQVYIETHLNAGANTVLLKVSSGEKDKYGVYLRIATDNADSISVPEPSVNQDTPDITGHTPVSENEAPQVINFDPAPIQQLRAMAESPDASPHHKLFFSQLLQRWHVADENDTSANALLSSMTTQYPDNPLLWREQGDSETMGNRKRLAYKKALDIDPGDQAAFLGLLRNYSNSPYAVKGLDLIRDWKKERELPQSALLEQAHILNGKGLREAAIDLLKQSDEDLGAKASMFLFSLESSRMTDSDKQIALQSILDDFPFEYGAVRQLRDIALRNNDEEAVQDLLKREQWLNPFSTEGFIQAALRQQGKDDFEGALLTLKKVLAISPDMFDAHRLSAILYHQMGDDANALNELRLALITRPSDPWCLDYLEFLQPNEETYASPFLVDWKTIQQPEDQDLSKANYLVLLHQRIVRVHANGNSSETVREAIKIFTETGVRYQQVRGVYYEGDSEEVRVISARVWKPDGTFYDAPAPRHQSTSNAGDAANRLYGDYNVAVLQFQGLEKGSVVELEYEKKDKGENIYADYFGDLFYIGDGFMEPAVRMDYVLITPKSREFYYKYTAPHYPASVVAPSLDEASKPLETESDSERIWKWSFNSLPTIPREPMMPSVTEIIPYLKISTFQTWEDMTQWYWNLSRDQLIPGAVIHDALARILTDYRIKYNIPPNQQLSDWDKVRAVNAFVNTDVRYLGLEFGIHGYKPHKVDDICNAQYGDCKDKASLAVAMLKEIGIEANLVIIRTTNKGEIDYELPSLGIFNHCIYYLPDIDGKEYWIDGTATFFDASELPSADAGANTLIVKPGGAYEFKRIPHSDKEENGAIYTTAISLDDDGTAQGFRIAEFRGLYNPVVRHTYENPVKAKETVDRILVGTYPGSQSSNIELSDLQDYATSERLAYQMTVPQYSVKQGDCWILPSTIFKDMMSQRFASLSEREYDLILNYPWTRTNIFTIKLPDGHVDVELPQNRSIDNPFGKFERISEIDGAEITIKEEIVFKPVRVSKEDYPEFREFCRLVDHYQDEKVSYKK